VKVIGFLNSASEASFRPFVGAFRKGLNEGGLVEGNDLKIEFRWADRDYNKLSVLASELVKLNVNVIVTAGGAVAAKPAIKATRKIPVLFVSGYNPAKVGLAATNATGLNVATTETIPQRLAQLRQLLPKTTKRIAVFLRPGTDVFKFERAAAKKAGLLVVEASFPIDLEAMFEEAVKRRAGALLVCADPSFTDLRTEIVKLASQHNLPAAYPWHAYVEAGGLMSYGPSLDDAYRRLGLYAALILSGSRPRKLPILMPNTFRLSINISTAKNLGLQTEPAVLRALADAIIE
jgi:putative ABC transport system substrate-binding protein